MTDTSRTRPTKAGGWPSSSANGAAHPRRRRAAAIRAHLNGLAVTSRSLCVVTAPMHELPRLSTAAGVQLLRTLGVKGSPTEFERLVGIVDGTP